MWIETAIPKLFFLIEGVTPHAGVWIETGLTREDKNRVIVTPHAGVWIETKNSKKPDLGGKGHAPRGRVDENSNIPQVGDRHACPLPGGLSGSIKFLPYLILESGENMSTFLDGKLTQ